MKRNYLYYLLIVLLLTVSCEKDEMAYTTTIETHVTFINNIAYCGGIISSDGNPTIKEVGVEWCTTSDFESNVSCSLAGDSQARLGYFFWRIANLKGATQYYVRAYARNNYSTIYGQVLSFKTPDVVPPTYLFSVSAYQFVTFSKGNLQYTQSTNTWSFASTQWEVIGTDNVIGGSVSSDWPGDAKYGTALADKVDLFCWSTSSTNFGVSTSEYVYSGSFVDWGVNKISNDAPNTWRTLTYNEWEYLLNNRLNASSLKGVAQVNGVNGWILLPDNWTCPAGVTFKSGFHSNNGYAAYQTFTAEQWSKLESAGAVFLPAAGYRYDSDVVCVQYYGDYWSATEDSYCARYLDFSSFGAGMDSRNRRYGHSVRLVMDLY